MNENNTYQRKTGFFGSVKQLGVTTISGANDVTQSVVNSTVNATAVVETATSIINKATTLWGNDLLADLEADAQMNGLHREIETIQQQNELDTLKLRIAEMRAKQEAKASTNA